MPVVRHRMTRQNKKGRKPKTNDPGSKANKEAFNKEAFNTADELR